MSRTEFARRVKLVRVKKSKWDGKISSDKAAAAAAKAEHAKEDRIEARILAIESKHLQPITGPMAAMSALLKQKSRPFRDGGWRMVFVEDYSDLREALDKYARQVSDAVQTTIRDKYDTIKAEAEKDLNGLIAGRFPTRERMLERYAVRILTDVVSTADECRARGMTEDEVSEREQSIVEEIAEGNKIMIRELAKMVENLHNALKEEDKRFHGTESMGYPLMDNVSSMLDQCERFNVTQDEKLAASIDKARKALAQIDMTQCKEDKLARKAAAKTAQSVMDDLMSF